MRTSPLALLLALAPLALAAPLSAQGGKAPSASASASASATASAAASASASAGRRFDVGIAPDPEPLVSQRKWVYEIIFHEGAIFVPTPRLRDGGKPTETPRRMGRFALELYNGPDLVERVRFDLPMLNGDPFTGKTRPRNAPPDFERRARVKASIEAPVTDRANRAVLLDRATGHRIRLPWAPLAR